MHAWLGGGGGGGGLWGTRGDGRRHHNDRGRRAVRMVAVAEYAAITAGGDSLGVGHATGGAVGRFPIVSASCWRIRAAGKKKKRRVPFSSRHQWQRERRGGIWVIMYYVFSRLPDSATAAAVAAAGPPGKGKTKRNVNLIASPFTAPPNILDVIPLQGDYVTRLHGGANFRVRVTRRNNRTRTDCGRDGHRIYAVHHAVTRRYHQRRKCNRKCENTIRGRGGTFPSP